MVLHIIPILRTLTSAHTASPKRFWETTTVFLTFASPLLQILASWLFIWERKPKPLHKFTSSLSLVAGLLAAMALIIFTHYSRVDEKELNTKIGQLAKQATDAAGIAAKANEKLMSQENVLLHQGDILVKTNEQLEGVSKEADSAVVKLTAEIAGANRRVNIETLIGRMNSDDAFAYDQLVNMKHFGSPQEEARVHQAVEAMIDEHNNPSYTGSNFQSFRGYFPATLPEIPERLTNKSAFFREEALKDLVKYQIQPSLVPKVVELSIHDPSLGVRTLAVKLIDYWSNQRFQPFRFDVQKWWNEVHWHPVSLPNR